MATADVKALIAHLTAKWGHSRACPMCGHVEWTVSDQIYKLTILNPDRTVVGGPVLPLIPILCTNCGNTAFINAIVSGALKSDTSVSAHGSEPSKPEAP